MKPYISLSINRCVYIYSIQNIEILVSENAILK